MIAGRVVKEEKVISTRRRGGAEKNQESEELAQILAAGINGETASIENLISRIFSAPPRLRVKSIACCREQAP
jgi:hypothetical protein